MCGEGEGKKARETEETTRRKVTNEQESEERGKSGEKTSSGCKKKERDETKTTLRKDAKNTQEKQEVGRAEAGHGQKEKEGERKMKKREGRSRG